MTLVKNFQDILEICRDNWITLQPKNLDLSIPDTRPVKYSGFIVSHLGIAPHSEKVKAIADLREPKDLTEVIFILLMFNLVKNFFLI